MFINRLKDILIANLNHQIENGQNFKKYFEDLDFEFGDWKKESEEYFEKEEDYSYQQQSNHQQTAWDKEKEEEAKYYKALEVAPGAGFEQIKKSYRKLMKVYHPDLFQGDQEKHDIALEVSREINEAYAYFEKKFGK